MLVGITVSVMNYFRQKKKYQEKVELREKNYQEYIARKKEEIERARETEKGILNREYPSEKESLWLAESFSGDLFDREPESRDFLKVRLGLGSRTAARKVVYSEKEKITPQDPLEMLPAQLGEQYMPVSYTHLDVYKRQDDKSNTVLVMITLITYKEGTMNPSEIDYAPWKVVRQLGQGSFGSVYEICREEFGETYTAALKVISIPQDESEVIANRANGMDDQSMTSYYNSVVQELTHEFAILSKLKGHTNIVGYEDHKVVPHANGIGCDIYIRMELLKSLTQIVSQRALERQEVLKLGIDICEALCLCENKSIIHRDIKPDNIFISENGDFELGDFGIARTASRTIANMSRKGTPNYMAVSYTHLDVYKRQPHCRGHVVMRDALLLQKDQ